MKPSGKVFHTNIDVRANVFDIRALSHGKFGQLWQAKCVIRGEAVVVKRVVVVADALEVSAAYTSQPGARNVELRCLRALQHPGIVRLVRYAVHDADVVMVMERACHGDLYAYVSDKYPQGMPEKLVLPIARDIAGALAHVHRHGVTHRDIKLENVIMAPMPKLIDFGMAHIDDAVCACGCRRRREPAPRAGEPWAQMAAACGTRLYFAPERLVRHSQYSCRVDSWALGVCILALLRASMPTDEAVERRDFSWHRLSDDSRPLSNDVRACLGGLLCVDPATRMAAGEAHVLLLRACRPQQARQQSSPARGRRVYRPSAAALSVSSPWVAFSVSRCVCKPFGRVMWAAALLRRLRSSPFAILVLALAAAHQLWRRRSPRGQ
jgi:serine/threonine protein kinase